MPDLGDLVRAAVEAAGDGEAVEAYAQESRQTEASALRGEVEGLTFAESRGLGVRLIRGGRLGYAFAADPTVDEVRAAVVKARENATLAEPDEFNVLPEHHVVKTPADGRNLVRRYGLIPRNVDNDIGHLREGMRKGLFADAETVRRTIQLIDRHL